MSHDPGIHLQPPPGTSMAKYKFLLWKRYFEMGYSITSYVKYMIALFGISSLNVSTTIILGLVYAVVCQIVGWAWFRYGFMEADTEITNRYNIFVKEMRHAVVGERVANRPFQEPHEGRCPETIDGFHDHKDIKKNGEVTGLTCTKCHAAVIY